MLKNPLYHFFLFQLQAELGGAEARMARMSITLAPIHMTQIHLLTVYAKKIHYINFFNSCFKMSLVLRGEYSVGGVILDFEFFFDGVGIFDPNIVYLSSRKKFKNESFLGR